MKVFILAGAHRVAERLAAELRLRRDAWAFANSERDLSGYQRVLVIEETDTAREHRSYRDMMAMMETRPDRYHVSPISLDWVIGIDRRSHMKLGMPTEFRREHQNAVHLKTDPSVPPGTMLAVDPRTHRIVGRLTGLEDDGPK